MLSYVSLRVVTAGLRGLFDRISRSLYIPVYIYIYIQYIYRVYIYIYISRIQGYLLVKIAH